MTNTNLPDIPREKLEALFKRYVACNERKNERRRLRYRLRREGVLPPLRSLHPFTWLLPNTIAHDLLKWVERKPRKLEEVGKYDAYQILRLMKWNLIFLSKYDSHIWLNRPDGEDALELLNQGVTATIYK